MRHLAPLVLFALVAGLIVAATATAAPSAMLVTPPPAPGQVSTITLRAEPLPASATRELSLTISEPAEFGVCGGLLFTGTWPPAVVPCVISGNTATIAATTPPSALLVLLAEARVAGAGAFTADGTVDGESFTYSAVASYRAYLPTIGTP